MNKRRTNLLRDIQLEFWLRWMIVALILVATILLGIGERSALLSILTFAVAGASIWLTDITGRVRLSQTMANLAALVVMVASAIHACFVDRHGLMLVVADLQTYLQYVLFFQPKTARVYWQLALLSLGQVAIASTLVAGPTFGIMLLAYLLIGIITFAMLLLYSETKRFRSHGARLTRSLATAARPALTVGHSDLIALSGNSAALDVPAIGRGLLEQSVLVVATTVVVTSAIFFLLPRWNVRTQQSTSVDPIRSIGFSKTVTLGEMGEVVRNPDVVMRIQFFRRRGQRPFKLIGEPLFRGTVVSRYENRRWTQATTGNYVPLSTEVKTPYVRQHITAEALDVPELFCIFPIFGLQADPSAPPDARLKVDLNGEQLVRQEEYRGMPLDFDVATPGIRNERQLKFLPCYEALTSAEIGRYLQMPVDESDPQDLFPGLRDVAARVLTTRNIDSTDRAAAATALSQYLRQSGEFFYALDAQVRDQNLDPLEDFVTQHRRGHCEYFAGALVMMLRSQGIPARMALGFKGGEWNSLGMYYQVQQLHAHAWVEVYLDKANIPEDAYADDADSPPAAWMTLDPTEGIQEANAAIENRGLLARVRQSIDYGYVLWSNYVVGLNSKRQRQGIYEPLVQAASAAVENLVSPQVWQARMRRLEDSRVGEFWRWYRRHWFDWWGGLVAVGFSLLVVGLYAGTKRLRAALRRLGLMRDDAAEERQVLEMYRRLETALARRGLTRQPGQTAYEFATAAGGDLAESLEHRRVAHLPRRVVEMFYRVRFGHRPLDNHESDAVEHALTELELALAASTK